MRPTELAGQVAIEIARQLADPIRGLRDRLGLVVDHLERHVATSTGPTPYPWRSSSARLHGRSSRRWGGTIDAASRAGQGCTFELRLATQ